MFDTKFILFCGIIFLAKAIEAVTGFGSTIIALTLGAQLYDLELLLPVVVPLNIFLSVYIVTRHARHINWPELTRWILPFTGAGLILGMVIFNLVHGGTLKLAYGIFVLLFAIVELIRVMKSNGIDTAKPLSAVKAMLWLFAGGVIHGIYASGGPMVVYYSGRKISDKGVFRSTLSVLWLVLNIILLGQYIYTGKITLSVGKMCAALLPALVLGIIVGDIAHKKIPERKFRILVYGLLIVAGASLVIKSIF